MSGSVLQRMSYPQAGELPTEYHQLSCHVRVSVPPQCLPLLRWMDIDVIRERPLLFSRNAITVSCTGPEPGLEMIVQFSKLLGTVTSIAYEAAGYRGNQVLPHV
jgi:hypothetical protein